LGLCRALTRQGTKRSELCCGVADNLHVRLSQRGVAAARIEAAGYGDTRPIAPNDTETNRAKNRRIEFRVLTQ